MSFLKSSGGIALVLAILALLGAEARAAEAATLYLACVWSDGGGTSTFAVDLAKNTVSDLSHPTLYGHMSATIDDAAIDWAVTAPLQAPSKPGTEKLKGHIDRSTGILTKQSTVCTEGFSCVTLQPQTATCKKASAPAKKF